MARQLLQSPGKPPVHLVLAKDTVKAIKSGHPWVYADSLASLPAAPAGSLALVKTKDGDIIAKARFCVTQGGRHFCLSVTYGRSHILCTP